jgi:hypothetical protein
VRGNRTYRSSFGVDILKSPTRKQLDKAILDLWAKCGKTRDKTCRHCGSDSFLQSHHIREKAHGQATRYNLENNLTLCRKCHSLQKFRPETFHDTIIEIIGQAEYDRLKLKSQTIIKWTMADLKEIKHELTAKLKRLENEYGSNNNQQRFQ